MTAQANAKTPGETPLRIGILGLDTSHGEAFTRLLNGESDPWHVPGGRVVCAWPGGSDDIPLSRDRVEGFTTTLREEFGVEMLETPEAVAGQVDALLVAALDARIHPELFERIAIFGKPVFVDKPLALTEGAGRAMHEAAAVAAVPLFSCSALRFAPAWTEALAGMGGRVVVGADIHAPLSLEATQPGYSWYGIHGIEMLLCAMGPGFRSVALHSAGDHELLVADWPDGRIGSVRFNRSGKHHFGGVIHLAEASRFTSVHDHPKPLYVPLVEEIVRFFHTGRAPVTTSQTLEVLRFVDGANACRSS